MAGIPGSAGRVPRHLRGNGSENSPALQRWESHTGQGTKSRRDGRTVLSSLKGLFPFCVTFPSAEALGYFRGAMDGWRRNAVIFAKNGHFPQKVASVFDEHRPVSGEHRPVFHAHRAVSGEHRAVFSALRPVFQRLRPVYGIHRPVSGRLRPVRDKHRPVSTGHRAVFAIHRPESHAYRSQPRAYEGRFRTGDADSAAPMPARLLEKDDPRVLGTRNAERGTRNAERGTRNAERGTRNAERKGAPDALCAMNNLTEGNTVIGTDGNEPGRERQVRFIISGHACATRKRVLKPQEVADVIAPPHSK